MVVNNDIKIGGVHFPLVGLIEKQEDWTENERKKREHDWWIIRTIGKKSLFIGDMEMKWKMKTFLLQLIIRIWNINNVHRCGLMDLSMVKTKTKKNCYQIKKKWMNSTKFHCKEILFIIIN